ncbi:hypothetical protein SELMODRAFT_422343 [Selaginella moellendorffii]|uniref:Uncharacterized protein n=1 Tax=Selaginella moellendorffii TaxID=88036 RepID=D8SI39_SELML|nr:hypothetical protein SELMODRAFT_422343 [Selaginella moellendorffii]
MGLHASLGLLARLAACQQCSHGAQAQDNSGCFLNTVVRRLDLRLCRVWDQACKATEVDMFIARVEVIDDCYDPYPLYTVEGPYGGITYADLRSGVDSLDEKTHRDLVKAVRGNVKRDVKRQMQMPKFSNSLAELIRRSSWKPKFTPSNVIFKSTPGAREFKERMACWAEQEGTSREVMLRFEARVVEELEDDMLCSKLLQERPGEMDFSANSCYEPDVYNQLVEWIEGRSTIARLRLKITRFEVAYIEQLRRDYKAREGARRSWRGEFIANVVHDHYAWAVVSNDQSPFEKCVLLILFLDFAIGAREDTIPAADHGSMELEPALESHLTKLYKDPLSSRSSKILCGSNHSLPLIMFFDSQRHRRDGGSAP